MINQESFGFLVSDISTQFSSGRRVHRANEVCDLHDFFYIRTPIYKGLYNVDLTDGMPMKSSCAFINLRTCTISQGSLLFFQHSHLIRCVLQEAWLELLLINIGN